MLGAGSHLRVLVLRSQRRHVAFKVALRFNQISIEACHEMLDLVSAIKMSSDNFVSVAVRLHFFEDVLILLRQGIYKSFNSIFLCGKMVLALFRGLLKLL